MLLLIGAVAKEMAAEDITQLVLSSNKQRVPLGNTNEFALESEQIIVLLGICVPLTTIVV